MEIRAADEVARTFSAVKDALDIRACAVAHPWRSRIHILYHLGPLWPWLSFYNLFFYIGFLTQYQAVLPASLLHADSRDNHNLRWEGPRCHYFLSAARAVAAANTHLLSTGCFFSHLASTRRFTVNPNTIRSKRKARRKMRPRFLFF